MSVSKMVVGRPTTVVIIFALVIGFGLYSASDLAIDLFPEIDPPVLILYTNYSGAGPEEVEQSVTRTLEGQLSNVSNVQTISSTSSEGASMIQVEFTYGTDMTEASNEIRDRIELVKGFLPEDASSPQIFKFDPSIIPILQLQVSGNRTPEELRQIAQDVIQPRVEQVEGVALAGVTGGRDRIIRVEIPQNRLEAYGLTFTQVAGALRGNNVQISGGTITDGNLNYLVRTAGEFTSIDEIKNTVVTYRGQPANRLNPDSGVVAIRLRDVAEVFDGYTDEQSVVYINGEPGVFVTVQKQSGTNSVQVADNVLARIDRINRALPVGVTLGVVNDTTEIIRTSLRDVSSSAITGAILAITILFIFLRSLKSTLIIAISIPVSIIVTVMLMYFAGLTLNLMTLTGLALGVGMLVDNSIVVLENIYRYREKGAKLTSSAILGSQEMITAIVASTLTTIFVFLPLAIFRAQLEVVGELFADVAFTVVISLLSSLAVAIFLIPVLASRYLPISSRSTHPVRGPFGAVDRFMGSMFDRLDNGYKAILRLALRRKLIVVGLILAAFVGSLFLIPQTGFEFMPEQDLDQVAIDVEMPVGTKLDVTRSVLQQLEQIAREEIEGIESVLIEAGQPSFFGFFGTPDTATGSLTITLPPFAERIDNAETVERKLRPYFDEFPGATISFSEEQGMGAGLNPNPIVVTLRSQDRDLMKRTAEEIVTLMEDNVPGVADPSVNLSEGLPQVDIVIDREKANALGLTVATIGQEVQAYVDGITAGRYNDGGDEFDILLIADQRSRDQLLDLNKIFVNNNFGNRIPLANVADTERTTGPVSIAREDQSRIVRINAGLTPGYTIDQVMPRVERVINENIAATDEMVIEYGGDFEDLIQYGTTFAIIVVISVFLVFGVMASQFESFLDPFIIIFTIPLTLIGVILIHVYTGVNFSVYTAAGLVVLVGIVVNNGIVLVDYTNLMRKRGLSLADACVEAGGNRLRPILMTSLTTILGLLPVAFAEGEGSSLVQPIAKTVVGGLSTGTLLTLFLIPVLYYIFNRISERRAARKERRRQRRIERHRPAQPVINGESA